MKGDNKFKLVENKRRVCSGFISYLIHVLPREQMFPFKESNFSVFFIVISSCLETDLYHAVPLYFKFFLHFFSDISMKLGGPYLNGILTTV